MRRRFYRAFVIGAPLLVAVACGPSNSAYLQERDADPVTLRLPVDGSWRVIRSPGHHRFAFDLAAVDDPHGGTLTRSRWAHLAGRLTVQDTHSWQRPVRAPISGEIRHAHDGTPDRERLSLLRDGAAMLFAAPELDSDDITPFAGNYVIIESERAYVLLAHLREGSLQVEEGDRVSVGDELGRIGNSGMSLEPHLHLQLMEQIHDLTAAEAPPFVIASFERWTGEGWERRRHAPLERGEVIRRAVELR